MSDGGAATSDALAAAKAAVAADPHALPDEPLLAALDEPIDARRLLDVAIARYLAVVDVRDATVEPYGRGTRAWLIEDKHLPAATAGRLVKVSRQLPIRPVMSEALTAGEMSIEHAAPILRTLAKLAPADREATRRSSSRRRRTSTPTHCARCARQPRKPPAPTRMQTPAGNGCTAAATSTCSARSTAWSATRKSSTSGGLPGSGRKASARPSRSKTVAAAGRPVRCRYGPAASTTADGRSGERP